MYHTTTTKKTVRWAPPTPIPAPASGDTGGYAVTALLAWLFAMAVAVVPVAVAAADHAPEAASPQATELAIPAQPLIPALNAFAERSGLQLLYSAEIAEGKTTPGVSGHLTPDQGLKKLLEGTGVSYRFVDAETVTLEPAPTDAVLAQAPNPPATPRDESAEEPIMLPAITVTASPLDETSYNVLDATTATKTDTPIMETPLSIQVVPKQVLEDQQVIALKDALKNVSGVQRSASAGNLYDGFIIRGFENDANIYRNGLRSCCFRYETANLEQIEVLKGPAAVLYGRIEPGGLVNLVTKRPLEQPYYALEQQFGSYDLYRTVAEATGPITVDGSLLYRFDLAYQSNNSFRDFVDLERVFVSPSLTWRLSERTEINLNVEYQDVTMQDDSGIPAIGRRPAPVPINRYLQDDVAVDETDRVLVELSWSHRLNEHWTVRNQFQANLTDYDQTIVTSSRFLDDRTLDRGLFDVGTNRNYS